jgi:flavin reductase (DIM6/NTAB) family NADH-FMN oxidoreductase RutF
VKPTPELFRQAWGKFPTGVTIITTRQADGSPYCTTANAVMSVSLDPLLVLVSIGREGATQANLKRELRFGINVLGEDDAELATAFASQDERPPLPSGHQLSPAGTALLGEALACMDCRVVQQVEAGDHVLFIAEVDDIEVREGAPLVFHKGRFRGLV